MIHMYIVSLRKKSCANIITADVSELYIVNKVCIRYSLLGIAVLRTPSPKLIEIYLAFV